MQRFIRKHETVEAKQFTTNNEPFNTEMNSIVDWLILRGKKARHDATDIRIEYHDGKEVVASVGDWIVVNTDNVAYIVKPDLFPKMFDLCEHEWEAVDDSDYDQCLICGDSRKYEQQYFGDELL